LRRPEYLAPQITAFLGQSELLSIKFQKAGMSEVTNGIAG
jgi:hypothetical protein